MLGQSETARLLQQCNGDATAIEEVLSAYVVWKYLKGRTTTHVLAKLKMLSSFLRITGQHNILEAGHDAFLIVAIECALGGESRIGVSPTTTLIGKEIWNRIRRNAGPERRLVTDSQYGGPAPVQAFLSPEQRTAVAWAAEATLDRRNIWAERYFLLRPQFANDGAPEYVDRSDGGTLPLYLTSPSNREQILTLAASIQQQHLSHTSTPVG